MNVSRNSLIYRFNSWGRNTDEHGPYEPRNLCAYFWRTVFKIVGLTVFIVYVIAAVGFLGWAYVYAAWMQHTRGTLTVHLIILGIVVVGFILWAIYYSATRSNALKVAWDNRPHPTETLVGQYASAKKRRVCPLIELTD